MTTNQSLNRYPFWSPSIVQGLRMRDWLRLAARHRFRIHPQCGLRAAGITAWAAINSALFALDKAVFARRVAATEIAEPPIFVIGHWRSGTTLMHELLGCDDRLAFPNNYECFAPHHFLLTERWFRPLLRWTAPPRRPMDNMRCGIEQPQEDDFALLALGAPTPLLRVAFPNDPPPFDDMLDTDTAPPELLDRWRQAMLYFVRRLTLAKGKRLVLKSPPHTGQIAELANLFPGAKFIHLLREPRALFSSSRRLWQALDRAFGLQIPRHDHLDEYVLSTLDTMYRAHRRQRSRLDAAHICDVTYEDLVRNPLAELQRVYDHLSLGDFEPARESVETHLSNVAGYRANTHELSRDEADEIDARWAEYRRLHAAPRREASQAPSSSNTSAANRLLPTGA